MFHDPFPRPWAHVVHHGVDRGDFEVPRWLEYSCALAEDGGDHGVKLLWRPLLITEKQTGEVVGGYDIDAV